MEPLTFKIRPFDRVFDQDGEKPFRASAVLKADSVLISIAGSSHRLPTVGRGADQWGEFVVIEPGEWSLEFGFVLTVEPEFSEDEPPACRVGLTRPQEREVLDRVHENLRSQGIDPGSVNVLIPPSTSISIYFHESGTVNGYSRLSSSPSEQSSTLH